MKSRFSRLFPYLFRNKRMLGLGAVALVAANILDINVLVLLGLATDMLSWRPGPVAIVYTPTLYFLLGTLVLTVLGGGLARFWMRRLIIGVSREIEFSLRNDLFAHFQRLSPRFYKRYPTGDLMARATNDLEAIRLVVGPAVMYLASVAVMLPLSLYAMVRISPRLTLITWLPLLLLAPLFYFFSSRIHRRFMLVQESFSTLSTRVQEILTGIRVVKSYAREDDEAGRFEALSQDYVYHNVELTKLQAFFIPMMALFVGSSLLALVWGGSAMIVSDTITHGNFISMFLLMQANIWPMAAIGWVFSLLERGAASMQRIDELFNEEPDIVDGAARIEDVTKEGMRIDIRDLTFTYPEAESPALSEVSLTLEPGRILGMTGPVGCGKSTLAILLARRFNPPRGTILIDGIDILDWPLEEYRKRISIVDQEPFIFSDTIGSNVGYGLREEAAGDIERFSEIARLAEEVEALPLKYETMLGERGINLSGGQRQRAALARALAVDPQLLILDDALSAVDTNTEEQIIEGLKDFMKGRTTILISHRIRTVSIADHIIYLDRGRVVEEGTHGQLMSQGGKYWELARRQKIAEEIEATA